ncbi:MAG: cytochrome c nitrite reductase small subunit [Firmicutes bacterium]|nr:cytochrome c nitrite reductase small subunit [Bacillota bacterium]
MEKEPAGQSVPEDVRGPVGDQSSVITNSAERAAPEKGGRAGSNAGAKKRRWVGMGRQWRLVTLLLVLLLLGLSAGGMAVFLRYTDRSEFCLSCHVMEQPYERWYHSAHRLGATCSDCHVPHQNLASKLLGKGGDGMRHLYFFYTNQIPDPIKLSVHGKRIVQENCLRCHGTLMERVSQEDRRCWECHRSVPHGY